MTVNPSVIRTVEALQDAFEAFGPVGSAVSLVLGGAVTVLGLIARAKSRKAALVPTLIAGI